MRGSMFVRQLDKCMLLLLDKLFFGRILLGKLENGTLNVV